MKERQKHILLVSYEFPPEMATGGIGSYMYHLASLLSGSGSFKVTVMSGTTSRSEVAVVNLEHYINILVPADNEIVFRQKALTVFEHYFANNLPDLIESPEVGACALEIKRKYPHVPLLVKLHSPGVLITKVSNTYEPLMQKIRYIAGALIRGRFDMGYWARTDKNKSSDPEYQICLLADRLYSPSVALKKWVTSYWEIADQKINVLPNPFLIDPFLYRYDVHRNTKTICFVGKLTILKGMYAFTYAMQKFLLDHPDYKLIIVGRDEPISTQRLSMRKWMEEQLSDVYKQVLFTGAVSREKVYQIIGECEICIVPSLWENYPNVILEAMAAGCAVIASNRGGIPEIIKAHQNGILINPLKSKTITKALNRYLTNVEFRYKIVSAARIDSIHLSKVLNEKVLSCYQSELYT